MYLIINKHSPLNSLEFVIIASIQQVTSIYTKYLGVTINYNLSWSNRICSYVFVAFCACFPGKKS